ncbi:MAG: LacI family DNA-binding transcriptional regulator [Paenibacillus macerans]|uniref:Bacterial regulatory s, lacI family protein n=1 Tax=Paenibacillus macerans TaxID=44252 RepID=A0A090ZYT0_PAEMA|nr:LacI family DNA-binding transcriptional regulator [Paenibacillus macerans]KFN09246.1 bacterial regulatory s, lacI family protein [Paenibacillus macerans]MBS5910865.1 LacI family DNA-binding transcriptional regulator [Paenibacillus macerans]MCY7559948.1 LacI family transcriptional regulator [Paenibacillus macerans]MDU5948893.1 LacI family DNA-binding transcriptional regulator [Paenibacillus macerans]MDU7477183.1 LacI family DNA-binding transcriptional regulator [Paenibacillus macerans]
MTVTIKDLAKLANVSHTTVSRALNNSPFIKEETKRKIMELAAQMNYTPNVNAKSLVMQRSYTIGLFFTSLKRGTSSSFFADAMSGVNQVIDVEYNLFTRGIEDYADYASIHRKRFDGIIVMSQSESDNAFIYHVLQQEIPLVVLNRQVADSRIINILSDDKEGAYAAGKHLIAAGHTRIAMIEGVEGFKSTQQRREGLLNALIDSGIPIVGDYFVHGRYDMESGFQAMLDLLKLEQPPTAVFCANDDMAIGAMKAAFERGKRVPEDISVIGFDDIEFAQFTTPSLTTIKRPIEEISAEGARKLLRLIDDPSAAGETLFLKTELMRRNSTAKPAGLEAI